MAWITPKTNWTANDGVDSGDFNRIEENINLLQTGGKEHVLLTSTGQTILARDGGVVSIGPTPVSAPPANADNLTITGTGGTGLSILCGTGTSSILNFGDEIDSAAAQIVWSEATKFLQISTFNTGAFLKLGVDNGVEAMRIAQTTRNVLIGTTADSGPRLVVADGVGSLPSIGGSTVALFQNNSGVSGQAYINIIGGNTGISGIYFGDDGSESIGRVVYEHSLNAIDWYTGNAQRMRLTAAAHLLVNTTSDPGETVHIDGSMRVTGSTHPFIVKSTGFLDDTWMDGTLFADGGITLSDVIKWKKYYNPAAAVTEQTFYAAVSSWVPTVGDFIATHGQAVGGQASSLGITITGLWRLDATNINIGWIQSNGITGFFTANSTGVTTLFTDVEIMSNFDAIT